MSITFSFEVQTKYQPEEILKFLPPTTGVFTDKGKIHARTDEGVYVTLVTVRHPAPDTLGYYFGIDPTLVVILSLSLSPDYDIVEQEKQIISLMVKWIKQEVGDAFLIFEGLPLVLWKAGRLTVTPAKNWTSHLDQFEGIPHVVEEITPDPDRAD